MLNRTTLAAVAALALLAGCEKKTEAPAGSDDPSSSVYAGNAAAKVELPPMPKSSKSYRCADQSVVKVQLFQGDLQANVSEEEGMPTVLKAEAAGKPFVAEGFELAVKGDNISLARPGHPKQDCKG